MKHSLIAKYTIAGLLLTNMVANSQESLSGGQSGYDQTIKAISPTNEKIGISLAGVMPADISRYILASNNRARDGQLSPSGDFVAFKWSGTLNCSVLAHQRCK